MGVPMGAPKSTPGWKPAAPVNGSWLGPNSWVIGAPGIGWLHVDQTPFEGGKWSVGNRLMIGVTTSVAAFTSGFGDLRDAGQGWMNVPLIVESLLGTLLWGLFIVAFGRKVIR